MSIAETATHWPVTLPEYHRDRSTVGASHLKLFARSPWRYRLWQEGNLPDPKPSAEVQLGSACHIKLFQPELFDELVCVLPEGIGTRTKVANLARRDAESDGKIVITREQFTTLCGMTASLLATPAVRQLLDQPGRPEHAIQWTDDASGIRCKCSFDKLLDSGVICDLKTTSCEDEDELRRDMYFYGWHLQAAWYAWGRDLYCGQPGSHTTYEPPGHHFIVVRSKYPYEANVYTLGERSLDKGRREIRQLLDRMALARDFSTEENTSAWRPDGYLAPATIDLPNWTLGSEQ